MRSLEQRRLTVIQLLPALRSGGAERSALEVGQALVAAGHRSIVISGGGRLVERLMAAGSEHIDLAIGRKSLLSLRFIFQLRRLFAEVAPDIVHARSRLPAWLGLLALARLKTCPHFVTTVHGLNSPGFYSSVMVRGQRVICVSDTVRRYVLQHYSSIIDPSRLRVIPRGVDPNEFPAGYQPDVQWRRHFFSEFPQLSGAPLLTLPGRGTRLKGHADAIELLAALNAKGIDCRMLLLGVDEAERAAYLDELKRLASERGVSDKLVMSAPRADVRDIYAISSLILQLSNKPESFGRTVVEALSLGRPVVGYAHGGVGELLAELYPEGCVPFRDRAQLLERAVQLLESAPALPPLNGYRMSDMQQATLALYHELLN